MEFVAKNICTVKSQQGAIFGRALEPNLFLLAAFSFFFFQRHVVEHFVTFVIARGAWTWLKGRTHSHTKA